MTTILNNALLTVDERIETANAVMNDWTAANTYLAVGGEVPYANNDMLVPVPNGSIDYLNATFRNMIALKKITAADLAFMVPRVDWQTGVTYAAWDDAVDMYSTLQLVTANGTITWNSGSRTISGNGSLFTSQLENGTVIYIKGDGQEFGPEARQVIDIYSNTSMNVNTSFGATINAQTFYILTDTKPNYVLDFYVRNVFDQVFLCMSGGLSNTTPQLALGGDLPTDTYIQTQDGLKWKYLYTIPSGPKQLFLTDKWMPVFKDGIVVSTAVDGRIDIVNIISGGSGYNSNVASNTATILTVVGDGTGATMSAKVSNTGAITGINILTGGQGYSTATIQVASGITGVGANLRAIIGPPGGHGFSPVNELGATTLMVSVDLIGNELGTIPIGVDVGTGVFQYRQIGVLQNPKLATGAYASNTNYSTITTISVQALPAGEFFNIDETVYQGTSLANATFTGTVVFWDSVNNNIWLNDLTGTFTPAAPITGTVQTTPITAFILTPSVVKPFSGRLFYVNDILPVTRGVNQTEQIRLLLEF